MTRSTDARVIRSRRRPATASAGLRPVGSGRPPATRTRNKRAAPRPGGQTRFHTPRRTHYTARTAVSSILLLFPPSPLAPGVQVVLENRSKSRTSTRPPLPPANISRKSTPPYGLAPSPLPVSREAAPLLSRHTSRYHNGCLACNKQNGAWAPTSVALGRGGLSGEGPGRRKGRQLPGF